MIQSSHLSEALQIPSNDQELVLLQIVPLVSSDWLKNTKESENVANQIVF